MTRTHAAARLLVAASALAFAASATPAFPQDKGETSAGTTAVVGQLAPEIQATDWIGGDGRTSLEDFRGEVVLLELWSTKCSTSCGQIAHLTRLSEDLGRRGLNVIGMTGEARDVVLRYMTHVDGNFGYAVALGGAPGYPAPGTPYSALIGPDGKVAYLGHPGSLSSKLIEEQLRRVQKPTPAQAEARAARMLASAEKLVADGRLVRADAILGRIVAKHGATESGKKAAARAKEIAGGELKAEFDAQKELAKLVGGAERPAEADSKKALKLAKTLEKKAADWKTSAPRASAMAAEWAAIFGTPPK